MSQEPRYRCPLTDEEEGNGGEGDGNDEVHRYRDGVLRGELTDVHPQQRGNKRERDEDCCEGRQTAGVQEVSRFGERGRRIYDGLTRCFVPPGWMSGFLQWR
jgi:hypothetical protein